MDDPDIEQVVAGERALLDPAIRAVPNRAVTLVHAGFREFGSSGTVYDRASILARISAEPYDPPNATGFAGTRLAPDVVHLVYRTERPGRTTLRSSIWRRDGGTWRIWFHQGTPMPGEEP